jgi:hypothetical protein
MTSRLARVTMNMQAQAMHEPGGEYAADHEIAPICAGQESIRGYL